MYYETEKAEQNMVYVQTGYNLEQPCQDPSYFWELSLYLCLTNLYRFTKKKKKKTGYNFDKVVPILINKDEKYI